MSLKDEIQTLVDKRKAELEAKDAMIEDETARLLDKTEELQPFLNEIGAAGGNYNVVLDIPMVDIYVNRDGLSGSLGSEHSWRIFFPETAMTFGKSVWKVQERTPKASQFIEFGSVESMFEYIVPICAIAIAEYEHKHPRT